MAFGLYGKYLNLFFTAQGWSILRLADAARWCAHAAHFAGAAGSGAANALLSRYLSTTLMTQIVVTVAQTCVVVHSLWLKGASQRGPASPGGRFLWLVRLKPVAWSASMLWAVSHDLPRLTRYLLAIGSSTLTALAVTTFLPFRAVHMLAVQLVLPFSACYALLEYRSTETTHDPVRALRCAAWTVGRALVVIAVQATVSDTISSLATELLNVAVAAAAIGLALIYFRSKPKQQ